MTVVDRPTALVAGLASASIISSSAAFADQEEIGNLDKVVGFGRVFGMVNAVPDFADHPKVIDGCSDLFVEVFGDRGRHARCTVG